MLFLCCCVAVPHLKHIRDKKSIHHNVFMYAACLCKKIENRYDKEVGFSIVGPSLPVAAFYDNYELVELILKIFSSLAYYRDHNRKNIFFIAIENRCKNVFKLVCQMSQLLHHLMITPDSSGNTILNLVGKLAPPNRQTLSLDQLFRCNENYTG